MKGLFALCIHTLSGVKAELGGVGGGLLKALGRWVQHTKGS